MYDRLQVKEYFEFDASGEFEGTLEEIKSKIEEFQSLGWEGIEKVNDGYGFSYDYLLYKFREETDEEYEYRLSQEQLKEKMEANKKEKRRQQYERLKKEFGE